MTRTARRRWTRELSHEVDGIALGHSGPVLLHGYEPPAGGRWVDSAIPGKLSCLERATGEVLWTSPCEVGYGRGFGAAVGAQGDVLVLGPSGSGHRIVRMSLSSGELLALADIPTFDEATVASDLAVCVSPRRVSAISCLDLRELWHHAREGQRYRHVGRCGNRVFVVFSQESTGRQGVLALDAATGKVDATLIAPTQRVIHDFTVDDKAIVLLTSDLAEALPRESLLEYLRTHEDADVDASAVALLALDPAAGEGDAPLWFEALSGQDPDEVADLALAADSGKLYLVRGALLEVRDALTGRVLGDWAVPGLDERVGWQVSQGAGLLAEETRVSIFELPA